MAVRSRTNQRAASGAPPRFGVWEQWLARAVLRLGRTPWGQSGNGRAHGIMRVFHLAERLLTHNYALPAVRRGGIVVYEIAPLPARRPLPLPGQRPVEPGELVLRLHFDNRAIAALAAAHPQSRRLTWHMLQVGAADLRRIAELARDGAFPPGIRAAWGETILYTALARLGFSTRPVPRTFRTPWVRLYMLGIVAIYGRPDTGALDFALERFDLGETWIALDSLQQRFGG